MNSRNTFLRPTFAIHNRVFHNLLPLFGDPVPVEFFGVLDGRRRHLSCQVRLPDQTAERFAHLIFGRRQQPSDPIDDVVGVIRTPGQARKSTRRSLPQHLWVSFDFARKEEYAGTAHLLAQLGGVQVAEKYNVAAAEILYQPLARALLFSNSCQPEFPFRMFGSLANHKVGPLVMAKGARKQDARPPVLVFRLRRRIVIPPVDAVVNRLHIPSSESLDGLGHVTAVARNNVALPNCAPQNQAVRVVFQSSGNHVSDQRRPPMQLRAGRKKSGIERAFPRKEVDIGNMAQHVPQNARCIPAFLPAKNSRVRACSDSRVSRAGAEHHHSKTRWIHARHDFLHRQILGVGIALVGERGREDRNHIELSNHGGIKSLTSMTQCLNVSILPKISYRRSRNRACRRITGSRADAVLSTCSQAACNSRFRVPGASPPATGCVSPGSASKSYTSSVAPGSIRMTSLKRVSRTARSLAALRLSARKGFVQP